MKTKSFIEVNRFGDFDILQTLCIMYKDDNKLSAKELRKEFCEMEGIKDPTLINDRPVYEVTEDFVAFLELKGFKKIITDSTYFCN